jgi:hypothetical protein
MMYARKSLSMTSGVFLVLFALSFVSAQNDIDVSPESDLESIEEIQELLRNVQTILETRIASKVQQETVSDDDVQENEGVDSKPKACTCSGLKCSCCQFIKSKVLNMKGNVCFSVTYIATNSRMLVSLKYDSRKLYNKEVSALKPRSICVSLSFLRRGATLCVQFSDLKVVKKSFTGCIKFAGRLLYVPVWKVNGGCFQINTKPTDALELPYIDEPEALPEESEVEMEKIQPADSKKNC